MPLFRVLPAALLAVFVLAPPSGAERLDSVSSEALSATLEDLRETAPGSAGPLDPKLAALERSPELRKEFSELSASILSELVARYGGDPEQMAAAVARAKSDPSAFAETLTPATRAKLGSFSRRLDAGTP